MGQIARFFGNLASSIFSTIFSIIIGFTLLALWIGLWVALIGGWMGGAIALGTTPILAAVINGIRNAWINAREQPRR